PPRYVDQGPPRQTPYPRVTQEERDVGDVRDAEEEQHERELGCGGEEGTRSVAEPGEQQGADQQAGHGPWPQARKGIQHRDREQRHQGELGRARERAVDSEGPDVDDGERDVRHPHQDVKRADAARHLVMADASVTAGGAHDSTVTSATRPSASRCAAGQYPSGKCSPQMSAKWSTMWSS